MYKLILLIFTLPSLGLVYLLYLHRKLSKIVHRKYSKFAPITAFESSKPTNFPSSAPTTAKIFGDCFEARVPTKALPPLSTENLLTSYLQHNMSKFASLPQGQLLAFLHREKPGALLSPADIRNCRFRIGDEVLGTYKVTRRDVGDGTYVVELGYKQEEHLEGAMVYKMKRDEDFMRIEVSEFMWDPVAFETRRLPLANWLARWWHEVTAMGLIKAGIKFLQSGV